eukprot:365131-Chlamydomonas_euryale.AAC.4
MGACWQAWCCLLHACVRCCALGLPQSHAARLRESHAACHSPVSRGAPTRTRERDAHRPEEQRRPERAVVALRLKPPPAPRPAAGGAARHAACQRNELTQLQPS